LDDRHFGRDRAVGPDLERELVVVGFLTNAGFLNTVANADYRTVDRVDRDDADLLNVLAVLGRWDVTAAVFDDHFHAERDVVGERGQDMTRVQHLNRLVGFDIASQDRTGRGLLDAQDTGGLAVVFHDERFDVEHDIGDVFGNAPDRREFVLCVVDFDLSDGAPL